MRRLVGMTVLAVFLAACGNHVAVPPPTAPMAIPTTDAPAGRTSVEGTVSEHTANGSKAIEGARIVPWFELGSSGRRLAAVWTDSGGYYRITDAQPGGFLVLYAERAGYRQPCGATVRLGGEPVRLDIEIVSDEALSRDATLPDLMGGTPTLSGVVFESTPGGRRPVADADVFFEWSMDLVTAMSRSDANGRYRMCRLPTGRVDVTAVKPGYATSGQLVQFEGDTVLDFELSRR
jgi:hypothetical protein